MADTTYRRPGVTLEDILAGVGSGAYGGGQGQPPSPRDQVLAAQEEPGLNALMEQAFAAPDLGPGPTPYKPNWGNKIAAALGDAAAAYGRAFAPQMAPTNYQVEQRGRKAQSQAEQDQFAREKAIATSEAGREKARFGLTQREARIDREDRQAQATELKNLQIQQQRDALKQAKDLAAAAEAATAAREAARLEWEKKKADDDNKKDIAVARIHSGAGEGKEQSKYDQKKLGEVSDAIGGLADIAQVALAGGDRASEIPKMTPQQMRNRIRRLIEYSGMSPDAKVAARAAANEVEQEIKDFEAAEATEAVKGTTVPEPPYTENTGYKVLDALGLASKLTRNPNLNPGVKP